MRAHNESDAVDNGENESRKWRRYASILPSLLQKEHQLFRSYGETFELMIMHHFKTL